VSGAAVTAEPPVPEAPSRPGRRRSWAALAFLAPAAIMLGDSVTLTLALQSHAAKAQRLAIDYAVHHVKASGETSAKVFKGWQIELAPHACITLVKRHSMRPVTTRRYHAGLHAVDVQINGARVAGASFMLKLPRP
jgi:hypothetical protein